MTRWRGLVELVQDAVHHGSGAVEKVHLRVAVTPFDLAARIPLLAPGARGLARAVARVISTTYGNVRGVNRVVGGVVGEIVEAVARRPPPEARACSTRPRRQARAP